MPIKNQQINISTKIAVLTGCIISCLFHPVIVLAASNPLNNGADWLLKLLTGPLTTTIAIIALVLVGYLGLSGRMAPKTIITVFIAIMIVFGAPQLISLIQSAVSSNG